MMKKKLRGFTLVDVTVSAAVMVILVVISSAVVVSAMSIFRENAHLRAAQTLGNEIYDFISVKLTPVEALSVSYSDSSASITASYKEQIIVSSDSVILKRGSDAQETIIGSEEMKRFTVFISFDEIPDDSSCVYMTIELYRDGTQYYSKKGIIPLLNYTDEDGKFSVASVSSGAAVYLDYAYLS